MDDPHEYALVVKAFRLARSERGYVTGYVEWCDDRAAATSRTKLADLDGCTPEAIREWAIDFVNDVGRIDQVKETREERSEYAFYYKIILPIDGFPRGIFIECRLIDEDEDDPTVHIVSAHRQGV